MIRIIILVCSLSAPADCHDETITPTEESGIGMLGCLAGMPQVAKFMGEHPQYRLGKWACESGVHRERT